MAVGRQRPRGGCRSGSITAPALQETPPLLQPESVGDVLAETREKELGARCQPWCCQHWLPSWLSASL